MSSVARRGRLSLANLPLALQREIRYVLHRHANDVRRTHWRPTELQKLVDRLADAVVATLSDPVVADLADDCRGRSLERRILLALLFAARSLAVTEETAKAAGWFDPIIVGSSPFPGTQGGENRRKPWDLTAVSQRWLRDLLWEAEAMPVDPVNGVELYWERSGSGPRLLFCNPSGATLQVVRPLLDSLADKFDLLA